MFLFSLILIPLIGIFIILTGNFNTNSVKTIALFTSILNLIVSLFIYILFDYSNIDYQFVEEIN